MDAAFGRETFDCCDGMAFGAERRDDAARHWLAIEEHGAGAAIAGIAAFLDAETAELTQEGAQALAGLRLLRKAVAVDLETHGLKPCSSARISSASRSVILLAPGRLAVNVIVIEVVRNPVEDRFFERIGIGKR